MLELKNIVKQYVTGDTTLNALDDVSLGFRKNEFVAILGPSGCGKTTLLNIVGGLDRYTSGDLVINNKSTKEYKDADWDNYRNHSVGFVFQSYNLIPHQTVLENVELALTLSGVSKEERRKRATDVLKKVGLKDKLKSKPNQLSGGQMQRVAIARALVNDPEIILADEPTGALDTASSLQVMELLKEISKDKLIIMVTHNPDLAEQYASRIVKLLDGKLIDDTKPFDKETEQSSSYDRFIGVSDDSELTKRELNKKHKKKRMSFLTALTLSFKNLLTKKARTILVTFAGSIGIIGIALVLSISAGFSTFINKTQEDALSNYPIEIEAKNINMTAVLTSMMADFAPSKKDEPSHENDAVYSKDQLSTIINSVGSNLKENNLDKFYTHIQEHYDELKPYVNAIKYSYNLKLEFYNDSNTAVQPKSSALYNMVLQYSVLKLEKETKLEINKLASGKYEIKETNNTDYTYLTTFPSLEGFVTNLKTNKTVELSKTEMATIVSVASGMPVSSFNNMNFGVFNEMIDNNELIQSQYEFLGEGSRFIQNENEALLVLDKNNELDDYVLYSLGLITEEQMNTSLENLVNGVKTQTKIDYSEILGKEYKVLEQRDYSNGNNRNDSLQTTQNKLKIVGIARLNEKTSNGSLKTGIVYSRAFSNKMMEYHNADTRLEPINLTSPNSIQIYVTTFEAKDAVQEFIDSYNENAENGDEISYTDYIGIILSSVSTIINAITYILIAFVSVSLVVSSIMIGIITYISVIERTKEIGVLRSVGASKRDVKRVFTAESFIIGLSSGVLGITVAALFNIPINLILKAFTGLSGIAHLPVLGAVILVLISVGLTFIAGLIPANVAAKKDPVKALRTE